MVGSFERFDKAVFELRSCCVWYFSCLSSAFKINIAIPLDVVFLSFDTTPPDGTEHLQGRYRRTNCHP